MTSPSRALPNSGVVLGLLLLAYIFNFLDRTILNILAGPIIADLKLTDTEFGAITGLAFAILYSVLGVPLALLADRTRRSWVVGGALAVWSGFTALCGTAATFGQLFLYRLGVGVGRCRGDARHRGPRGRPEERRRPRSTRRLREATRSGIDQNLGRQVSQTWIVKSDHEVCHAGSPIARDVGM